MPITKPELIKPEDIKPEDIKPGDWIRYRGLRDSLVTVATVNQHEKWIRTKDGWLIHFDDVLEVRRG